MSAFFVVANISKVIVGRVPEFCHQMLVKLESLTCASAGDEMKARTRRVLPKGPTKAIACSVCSACTLCSVCSACRLCSDCGVAGPSQGTTVGPQLPQSYFPSCNELLAVSPTVGSLREAIPGTILEVQPESKLFKALLFCLDLDISSGIVGGGFDLNPNIFRNFYVSVRKL